MPRVKKPKRPLGHHFLREWRAYRGMSQEQVAALADLSRTQLSKIEGRKQPYSQQILERLAEIYGACPGALIERNPLTDDDAAELADVIKGATPEQRRTIRVMVESFLKASI